MAEPVTGPSSHTNEAALIERFDSVLYPVDIPTLLDRLPELGWLVSRRADDQRGSISLTDAPTKGNSKLRMDVGNKTLGVVSNDLNETLETYRELRQSIRELGELAPEVRTDYVEFRYSGWIRGQASPVQAFSSWGSGDERVVALGRQLGTRLPTDVETLSPYGIRFSPAGLDANRPNWAELSIVPLSTSGTQLYSFDLLFRNEDWETVESVAEAADNLLGSVIGTLEETHEG